MSNKLKEILVVDIESSKNPQEYQDFNNDRIIKLNIPDTSISEVGIVRYIPDTGEIIVDEDEDLFLYDIFGNVPTDFWGITNYNDKKLYTFKEVSDILQKKYHSKRYTWVSWGDYDNNKFIEESAYFNNPRWDNHYPFSPNHINLKLLFALKEGFSNQVGMAHALKKAKLPLEGTHHRGRDDAYNIAKLLRYIFGKE